MGSLYRICILISLSCGDEDILAPSTATLSLSVNPGNIPADGSSTATIQAILQDSEGKALDGYTVYFTTTLGTITEKAEVVDGIARATLTAGNLEGTATIRAFSGTLSDTVQVNIGFQDVSIFLTANPPEIPANGEDTALIEAFVTEQGGIVPDGTDVFFTTTLGSITTQAETQNGRASATLTAGFTEGTATITAIVSNTSQTITMDIGIEIRNITLIATPDEHAYDSTKTSYRSEIKAIVWDEVGAPIEDKAVVFSSDEGLFDLGSVVLWTDTNGQVTDSLEIDIVVSENQTEIITITAISGETSTSTTIKIIN
jgi:hypothetical protein